VARTHIDVNSNRNGIIVASSEAERFTLHQTLRSLMPEAVADTLMAHLLPAGWSDVARTSDIDALATTIKGESDARFAELRVEIQEQFRELEQNFTTVLDRRDARFETRFERLETRMDNLEATIDARFEKVDERFDELASMKRYVVSTGVAIIATVIAMGSPLWFDLL
jgi:hypothetical protein